MANIDQATFLYKGNVLWLAPTPVYLLPNVTYRLTLRIEQDPLKVWPFRDAMCTPEMLALIQAEYGYTQEQLIPFLVQLRGLWHKQTREDGPDPSVYQCYYGDMPDEPDSTGAMGPQTFLDKWRGYRVFRTGLRIQIGDDPEIIVPMHDPQNAVVGHINGNTPYNANVPARPRVYTFAYSKPDWLTEVQPQDRTLGVFSASYGGQGWTVDVAYDGYCITTVTIESEGREIRVGVHVEQDEIACPQGLGTNVNTTVECWQSPAGGGPKTRLYTFRNPLPWSCMGSPGYGNNLGVSTATTYMWSDGNCQPRETTWSHGGPYSLDSSGYDWADVGEANAKHYGCMMSSGESYIDALDPGGNEYNFTGATYSPALAGAGVINYSGGAFGPVEPFATGSSLGFRTDTDPNSAAAIDNWKKWRDTARKRHTEFNTVYAPPRVKISGSFEVVNVMAGPAEFALFGELPHTYDPMARKLGFLDVCEPETAAIHYFLGLTENIVHDYNSDDWFSRAVIGSGILNCEFKLGYDGCSSQWLETLDGFDLPSTIPEDKFVGLREETGGLILDRALDDTYIFDERTPLSYQAWLLT